MAPVGKLEELASWDKFVGSRLIQWVHALCDSAETAHSSFQKQ